MGISAPAGSGGPPASGSTVIAMARRARNLIRP
jgi:hypothetical protein